jgi:hypothetical protein
MNKLRLDTGETQFFKGIFGQELANWTDGSIEPFRPLYALLTVPEVSDREHEPSWLDLLYLLLHEVTGND